MPDFTVRKYGTDPNGRSILMTAYMELWWLRLCGELGFEPTIVQGAFMARVGGGASASAGYHDEGGCLDLRVWNLTGDQTEQVIRTCRRLGAAAWVRDHRHGMDPHIHLLLGSDQPLASGARTQWGQYVAGRDGLSGNGPDYHWRPSPLVTTPPPLEDDVTPDDFIRIREIVDNAIDRKLPAIAKAVHDEPYEIDGKAHPFRRVLTAGLKRLKLHVG